MQELYIYNTINKKKEKFESIIPNYVGMYVCGPTVYGNAHLGHARSAISFDILYRYLMNIGYKVRYVRNITDVGHLTEETGEGDDKIAKQAKLEKLEPMEVVQTYTNNYRRDMSELNVLSPSIEPQASGHIIEQIELVKQILDAGLAYEVNGSVYFDVEKYNQKHNYGKLSGRKIEDLLETTRELNSQDEKRKSFDFALWKKADASHIMRWPSPWSDGYPGWHLECTAMGGKYLGDKFDIHGGGLDLAFPHHECEIAQAVATKGEEMVNYWMHNNMITIGGQKMGKSLNNFITLEQFFSGEHKYLSQSFSPMTIRMFILQAHYRSTLDFSNDALLSTQKGLEKLTKAYSSIDSLPVSDESTVDIKTIKDKCYAAMNDDLNTPILLSHIFTLVKQINNLLANKAKINAEGIEDIRFIFNNFVCEILGIELEVKEQTSSNISEKLIELLIQMRTEAKQKKDYAGADAIRDRLSQMGVILKDTRQGVEWEIVE
jgi:cysteinyl-tRNA synthetase